jgi:hypothetical protein
MGRGLLRQSRFYGILRSPPPARIRILFPAKVLAEPFEVSDLCLSFAEEQNLVMFPSAGLAFAGTLSAHQKSFS